MQKRESVGYLDDEMHSGFPTLAKIVTDLNE
jgi:hypothetical protein